MDFNKNKRIKFNQLSDQNLVESSSNSKRVISHQHLPKFLKSRLLFVVLIVVLVVASHFYIKNYNSIEKKCERQFSQASGFFQTQNKTQKILLNQAKKLAIEECIKQSKSSSSEGKAKNKPTYVVSKQSSNISPTITKERLEILESFKKQYERSNKLRDEQAKWFKVCGDLAYTQIKFNEELNLPFTPSGDSDFNITYKSIYGYSISYPNTWKLTTKEIEEVETVFLNKKSNPEIEIAIGSYAVYSTSGALCANRGCYSEVGIYDIYFKNGQAEDVEIIAVLDILYEPDYELKTCTRSFELEEYRIRTEFGKYKLYESDDRLFGISVFASFKTPEEGVEIQNILSTLNY